MNATTVVILLAVLSQPGPPPSRNVSRLPAALERAFTQRTTFKTAKFQYRFEIKRTGFAEVVENNEVRWAGNAVHCIMNGDDEGIVSKDARSGEANLGIRNACLPRECVVDFARGAVWSHDGSYPALAVSPSDNWFDYVDMRTLGLEPVWTQRNSPQQLIEKLRANAKLKFRTEELGGKLVRVIGSEALDEQSGTVFEHEWEIDTDKGPSVLFARQWILEPGKPRQLSVECRNELAQIDGHWWPMAISFIYPHSDARARFEFRLIEFDRKEHAQKLDADSLGVPIGVFVQSQMPQDSGRKLRYVGAGATVDFNEWERIKSKFDLAPRQAFIARMSALGPGYAPKWWDATDGQLGLDGIADQPDQWEAFLRRWTIRHTANGMWKVPEPLTEEQRTASRAVLKDCREKAAPIRQRCDAERSRISAEVVGLEKQMATTQPADKKQYARIESLRRKRDELEKPKEVAALFAEFKTRLDGLLTSSQRDPTRSYLDLPSKPALVSLTEPHDSNK